MQRESLRLKGYFVDSSIGQHRCKFKREVFYPILDHVHAEMEKRFNKTNCDIMRGIQALSSDKKSFLSEEIVLSLACLYDCDIDCIKLERLFKGEQGVGMNSPVFWSLLPS